MTKYKNYVMLPPPRNITTQHKNRKSIKKFASKRQAY